MNDELRPDPLDAVNRRLLAELHSEPRATMSALARRVGIAELAVALPSISECHRISGEDCFLIKVHAATIESLTETLDKILVLGQTITSIVHSSPVRPGRAGKGQCITSPGFLRESGTCTFSLLCT